MQEESQNGISSSPLKNISSMITLYMGFLSLHNNNFNSWDIMS